MKEIITKTENERQQAQGIAQLIDEIQTCEQAFQKLLGDIQANKAKKRKLQVEYERLQNEGERQQMNTTLDETKQTTETIKKLTEQLKGYKEKMDKFRSRQHYILLQSRQLKSEAEQLIQSHQGQLLRAGILEQGAKGIAERLSNLQRVVEAHIEGLSNEVSKT